MFTKCPISIDYFQEFWFPENVGFPWYDKTGHSPSHVRLETHYDNQEQKTGKFGIAKILDPVGSQKTKAINSTKIKYGTLYILIHI